MGSSDMVYGEISSGGVYAKGEVAREEAEEKQRKREHSLLWRKNKQEKIQKEKAERFAKREKKRLENLAKLELKNAPTELYAYADEQSYRQRLTQYFEANPSYISALKYDRPTTDELLYKVLGLIPKRCGQKVRMAFGRVMRDLGFEQVQGVRSVKLSDEQILQQIKRKRALVEELREQVRHASGLTKKQKRLINEGPPADKPEKCSYWRRPFTKADKAPPTTDRPVKLVYKTATSPKLPARTTTVVQPIPEPYERGDTKKAIQDYLADNPDFSSDGFTLDSLRYMKPPIPFVGRVSDKTLPASAQTVEALFGELGYVKRWVMNYGPAANKTGNYWFKAKPEAPRMLSYDEQMDVDIEEDLAKIAAKKAVTGSAPDALDDYYDELDDDLDEDFA